MLTCSYADRREILEFIHHVQRVDVVPVGK